MTSKVPNNEGAVLIRIGDEIYTVVKDPVSHKNSLYRLVELGSEEIEELLNKLSIL